MRLNTLVLLLAVALPSQAISDDQTLASFDKAQAAAGWQAVNDGVMGGRSQGRFRITNEGHLEFSGTLSLENNGGFASVRSTGRKISLQSDDVVKLRVKGDGRTYAFNLYTNGNRYSFRQTFATQKDRWVEVALPLHAFTATWRGRDFPNQKLDPARISGVGVLLGDKQPGPFLLEIDWIKAGPDSAPLSAVPCDGRNPSCHA